MVRTNCVIATWSGARRNGENHLYLKKIVQQLLSMSHSLDQITVCVANNPNEPVEFTNYLAYLKSLPLPIHIIHRPNLGLSYGAYCDAYNAFGDSFDYYIFIEDDYYFAQPCFDKKLIDMFEAKPNCSYLCSFVSRSLGKTWMGNSNGITSSKMLSQVKQRFGRIPYDPACVGATYTEESGQVTFSDAFSSIGELRDITSHYLVTHYYWQHGYCKPIPGQEINSNKPCLILPYQAINE